MAGPIPDPNSPVPPPGAPFVLPGDDSSTPDEGASVGADLSIRIDTASCEEVSFTVSFAPALGLDGMRSGVIGTVTVVLRDRFSGTSSQKAVDLVPMGGSTSDTIQLADPGHRTFRDLELEVVPGVALAGSSGQKFATTRVQCLQVGGGIWQRIIGRLKFWR